MWRDMWPSMVTHTQNLCSPFILSKVHTHTHTHSSEHTPGAVGSRLWDAQRAVGGSVPCLMAPQSWYWRWRESAVHSLTPPTIPAGTENRTLDLWVTRPTLTIRPWLPHRAGKVIKLHTHCTKWLVDNLKKLRKPVALKLLSN